MPVMYVFLNTINKYFHTLAGEGFKYKTYVPVGQHLLKLARAQTSTCSN